MYNESAILYSEFLRFFTKSENARLDIKKHIRIWMHIEFLCD